MVTTLVIFNDYRHILQLLRVSFYTYLFKLTSEENGAHDLGMDRLMKKAFGTSFTSFTSGRQPASWKWGDSVG